MRFSGSSNPSGGFVNTVVNTVTVDPATVVAGVTGAVGSVTAQVDTKPTAAISTVSTFVPILTRDAYYWPAVSGEQLAPTRNAQVVYASKFTKAAYKQNGANTGGADLLNFPSVSRAPSDTTKHQQSWSWKHLQVNAFLGTNGGSTQPSRYIFRYGLAASGATTPNLETAAQIGIGWGIYWLIGATEATGSLRFVISDGVSNKQDIAVLVNGTTYAKSVFHAWQVVVTNTTATVFLDGVQVGATTLGWADTSTTDPNNLQFSWSGDANTNNNQGDCMTEVQAIYA